MKKHLCQVIQLCSKIRLQHIAEYMTSLVVTEEQIVLSVQSEYSPVFT